MSDKIHPRHLARKAILYVRQSSSPSMTVASRMSLTKFSIKRHMKFPDTSVLPHVYVRHVLTPA